jgi:hypothetical protein
MLELTGEDLEVSDELLHVLDHAQLARLASLSVLEWHDVLCLQIVHIFLVVIVLLVLGLVVLDESLDFTSMGDPKRIRCSEHVHQANIRVLETGIVLVGSPDLAKLCLELKRGLQRVVEGAIEGYLLDAFDEGERLGALATSSVRAHRLCGQEAQRGPLSNVALHKMGRVKIGVSYDRSGSSYGRGRVLISGVVVGV